MKLHALCQFVQIFHQLQIVNKQTILEQLLTRGYILLDMY